MMHRPFLFSVYLCLLGTQAAFGVTYSYDVKPIVDKNCTECHDGMSHDPDLTSFPFYSEKISSQEEIVGKILEKVEGQIMPPGNRPKLTASEAALIRQWKEGGLQP